MYGLTKVASTHSDFSLVSHKPKSTHRRNRAHATRISTEEKGGQPHTVNKALCAALLNENTDWLLRPRPSGRQGRLIIVPLLPRDSKWVGPDSIETLGDSEAYAVRGARCSSARRYIALPRSQPIQGGVRSTVIRHHERIDTWIYYIRFAEAYVPFLFLIHFPRSTAVCRQGRTQFAKRSAEWD
jgi:hypothetical protein